MRLHQDEAGVSALKTINPEDLYSTIHKALRSWHHLDVAGLDLFAGLLTLRPYQFDRRGADPMQRRQALNKFLAETIATLAEYHPDFARILRQRFIRGELIASVALDMNFSEDQVNRLQREAIEYLAAIIYGKEQAARTLHKDRLMAALPGPSYGQLVGVQSVHDHIFERLLVADTDQLVALVGLGGIGKTALADAVARQAIQTLAFEDVVWMRAELPPEGQALNPVAAELVVQIARSLENGEEEAKLSLGELNDRLHHRPHLIVIDNLHEELVRTDLLDRLASLAGASKFLLTSRLRPPMFPHLRIVTVPELARQDAKQLLLAQAAANGWPASAKDLEQNAAAVLKLIGGNPLALKLVVGLLDALPLSRVLQALRRGPGGDIETMYRFIYQRAWQALQPEARRLLLAMPAFDAWGVKLDALQAASGLSDVEVHAAIKQLITRSLVELRGPVTEPLYGIHQLTHTFLQSEALQRF
jgi:hypothetical protein